VATPTHAGALYTKVHGVTIFVQLVQLLLAIVYVCITTHGNTITTIVLVLPTANGDVQIIDDVIPVHV
jgi:hypothetical protein